MSDLELGVYLESVTEQWASSNSSLLRVYLIFGYDIGLNIIDGFKGVIGHRYRMMRLPSGKWESFSFTYKRTYSIMEDGLPGVLEKDVDFWG